MDDRELITLSDTHSRTLVVGHGETRVRADLTPAAASVISRWDDNQRRRAGHEAAHSVAAALHPGIRLVGVSIKGQHGAWTAIAEQEDDQPEWQTRDELRARLVTLLAGRAFDIMLFGQPTSGSEHDVDRATEAAVRMFDMGMLEGVPLVGRAGWGYGSLPARIEAALVKGVLAELERAATHAAALVAEHSEQIVQVADLIWQRRRLSERELYDCLVAAGLQPTPLGE